MSTNLKIVAFFQTVLAFIIVFTLNYFALEMSVLMSITGAVGFTLLIGSWAAYRYNRYLKKQAKKEVESISVENVKDGNKEKPASGD
jgi:ABC-type transport system involved in cytochrome bd biosynthesis fused ATPase/permease subunit